MVKIREKVFQLSFSDTKTMKMVQIILLLTTVALVTSKPVRHKRQVVFPNSPLWKKIMSGNQRSTPKNQELLQKKNEKTENNIKVGPRIVNGIRKSRNQAGFSSIMVSNDAKMSIKKRMKCLKYVYTPILDRWKCKILAFNHTVGNYRHL